MTCSVTSREEAAGMAQALSALSLAFGSLKPVLYGGRRTQKALEMWHMKGYRPREWDQMCKARQSQDLAAWKREIQVSKELMEQAREDLRKGPHTDSLITAMAKEDLKVANRWLSKPAPAIKRSSFTGQMESQSHAQVLADLKQLPIRPGNSLDPLAESTDTASGATRLKTYRRVMNMRKRARRAIRAGGGKAA